MEKKITYVEALTKAMAIVEVENVEVAERLGDLKASLVKKAEAKSAKKAVDNSAWEVKVRDVLSNAPDGYTPTELMTLIDAPNTQKVSAVVGKMSDVVKCAKGKKVIYKMA